MAGAKLTNVIKRYGDEQVVHGIDLEIADGEFVVLVGPSGCGKSTLLRMIAGLEEISDGTIAIGDEIVNDVAAAKRGVAMVFQSYALYPHMSVYKNMAFGLRQNKTPNDEIDRRVRAAAADLKITDYLERMPRALSGGQRQRVAIGRAIVREPRVFLFDEPLSNLDAALRAQTRQLIARLHRQLRTTMVYVTHDQVEAMTLADKIVVLRDGHIQQIGSPIELYRSPSNEFVAQFIGSPTMNLFDAGALLRHGRELLPDLHEDWRVGVRPEHFRIAPAGDAALEGAVQFIEHLGDYQIIALTMSDKTEFAAKIPGDEDIGIGETLRLSVDAQNIHVFEKGTGQRLLI